MFDLEFKNPFIRAYLQYVHMTEPPLLMHVWSAIAAGSACMGRHTWLPFALGNIYANKYILLVGPPGTRKSSALNLAAELLNDVTSVRLAPDDTDGLRQGLMVAMHGEEESDDLAAEVSRIALANGQVDVDRLGEVNLNFENAVDRHVMHVNASEFDSFIGQNAKMMATFLIKMWDGDDYDYGLKASKIKLLKPLLSIGGATTVQNLTTALPTEAIGQGFMSRVILVYASKPAKSVPPRRVKLDLKLKPFLQETYQWISQHLKGAMKETPEAAEAIDKLYDKSVDLGDSRFIYYAMRRSTHLQKLCMILTALRQSDTIELTDVIEAETLLEYTELFMKDALGEYGMNPIAKAKQEMVDVLRFANGPILSAVLWAMVHKNMKLLEFKNAIAGLINSGMIAEVTTSKGQAFVATESTTRATELENDLLDLVGT